MEINSNAPIVSRHEIAINAPLESVWRVFTGIDSWSEWNPDITKATVTGPIAVGTVIHWETAGMAIPSTIGELVPVKKIACSGKTGGILGIHAWTFSATAEVTPVRTEESWEGPVPAQTRISRTRWTRLSCDGSYSQSAVRKPWARDIGNP